jgi:hypothetical protein
LVVGCSAIKLIVLRSCDEVLHFCNPDSVESFAFEARLEGGGILLPVSKDIRI